MTFLFAHQNILMLLGPYGNRHTGWFVSKFLHKISTILTKIKGVGNAVYNYSGYLYTISIPSISYNCAAHNITLNANLFINSSYNLCRC
jgi:hypothetical protein